jgi:regulator of replication initiation timing
MMMDQTQLNKIATLEKQLATALRQLSELNQRVSYLERENSRRKTELGQVTSALSRG